ncbi:MAG: hypothetical protein AB1591_09805 [Pseudomonadota bacterium]
MKIVLPLLLCLVLAACSRPIRHKDGTVSERPVSLSGIAKRDVDDASEIAQREAIAALKRLAEKLYRRNPAEWRKGNAPTLEAAVASIFDPLEHWRLSPRSSLDWQTSLNDAFREDYAGDRVAALMQGLLTMVMASYEHKTELYMLDELDPQKLYNAARNIEIAAWRLSNAKKADGELLLLSNGTDSNGVANLSFEREFGKLVATQDLIARIIEDKTSRSIRFIVVNLASLAFLPI